MFGYCMVDLFLLMECHKSGLYLKYTFRTIGTLWYIHMKTVLSTVVRFLTCVGVYHLENLTQLYLRLKLNERRCCSPRRIIYRCTIIRLYMNLILPAGIAHLTESSMSWYMASKGFDKSSYQRKADQILNFIEYTLHQFWNKYTDFERYN